MEIQQSAATAQNGTANKAVELKPEDGFWYMEGGVCAAKVKGCSSIFFLFFLCILLIQIRIFFLFFYASAALEAMISAESSKKQSKVYGHVAKDLQTKMRNLSAECFEGVQQHLLPFFSLHPPDTNSHLLPLKKQISEVQKKIQELAQKQDMSLEEKMKKRQEYNQQIADLNAQLRQHEIRLFHFIGSL